MGRNMFAATRGPWIRATLTVGWGDNPPYHHPVFVLTRYPARVLRNGGGTTFNFADHGIEGRSNGLSKRSVGAMCRRWWSERAQQYIKAGLVDEMEISLVPILLARERLFDGLGDDLHGLGARADGAYAAGCSPEVREASSGRNSPPPAGPNLAGRDRVGQHEPRDDLHSRNAPSSRSGRSPSSKVCCETWVRFRIRRKSCSGDGITKGELAAYYEAIAPLMVPHIDGRPGHMGGSRMDCQGGFFAKGCLQRFPEWLERVEAPKKGAAWCTIHSFATDDRVVAGQPELQSRHTCGPRARRTCIGRTCAFFDLDPSGDEPDVLRTAALAVRDTVG